MVRLSADKIGLTPERMDQYFRSEARTSWTTSPSRGSRFLVDVCGMESDEVSSCIQSVAP